MREIRAPRGSGLSCKGWQQEAALRMLMNSLDDEVAEDPGNLIVCGGAGKAAQSWECYHATVQALRELDHDETLLVQSGKPIGVFRTHEWAPRALIVNANLVSRWPNRETGIDRPGIMVYGANGRMTAGSWIYTGTQGVLQDTYEIFAAASKKHFGSDLGGKLVVSGGMGGMGGVQPLAAALNGAAFLGIEADGERIKRRIRAGYCDYCVNDLNEALRILKNAVRQKQAISVGLVGNCADVLPELAQRGVVPDLLTDQTSAHDPLHGYIPSGLGPSQAVELRAAHPEEYLKRSYESIARHVAAMLELQKLGSVVFEYDNNIRAMAFEHGGVKNAYNFPDFIEAYLRPMLCEGRSPLQWVALSGDPTDIYRIEEAALEMFPENSGLSRWIQLARKHVKFQGLPARAGWLRRGEQAQFGERLDAMVARGELEAPIVIGQDEIDCGPAPPSCAAGESMENGRGAAADWTILNALLNAASGASWVSIEDGGGAGAGYSMRASQAIVADGAKDTAKRIERVLTNGAAIVLARLAGAGYDGASDTARKYPVKLPMA